MSVFTATAEDQLLFEQAYLSQKPLCSDAKTGPYRHRKRQHALEHAYIESNPLVMRGLVVTDRDVTDTDLAADLADLPAPTYTALNPHTGSGHIVYGLKRPVCLTDAARRRPVNLLARIEHGLNTVLDGDASYGGNITKNPLNAAHVTLWGEALYSLGELATALDEINALPTAGNPRKNVQTSVVGRNVSVFDITRKWSYSAIRKHWHAPITEWERAVFTHAHEVNETIIANDFTAGPLGYPEVASVARSIARWTWRNFTPKDFQQRQANIARKGGAKRRAEQQSITEQILNLGGIS